MIWEVVISTTQFKRTVYLITRGDNVEDAERIALNNTPEFKNLNVTVYCDIIGYSLDPQVQEQFLK